MITAYIKVNENRAKLIEDAEKLSNEQLFELAQETVTAYHDNKAAFHELLHFQQHAKILGRHPIFDEDNLKAEIEAMPDVEALNLYKNMASQISRQKAKVKKNKADEEAVRELQRKQTKRQLLYKKLHEKQIL